MTDMLRINFTNNIPGEKIQMPYGQNHTWELLPTSLLTHLFLPILPFPVQM